MAKYRKKPIVIEATQWFKNGDHPLDYVYDGPQAVPDAEYRKRENWEGLIVRYFRRPEVTGNEKCARNCYHHR